MLARAYAGWDRIGGLDRPDLDVRKMILYEFLSWRRMSWRLIPSADPGAGPASAVPDHAYQHCERAALLAEIGKLPRQQRAVLVLRYYEDRGDNEIAELLGHAPATVRSYAARGLAALRIELRPQQPAVSGSAGEGLLMRNEGDLRAALRSLESHAPDPAAVMRTAQAHGALPARLTQGCRWRRVAAPLAAAASVVAVVAGVLV